MEQLISKSFKKKEVDLCNFILQKGQKNLQAVGMELICQKKQKCDKVRKLLLCWNNIEYQGLLHFHQVKWKNLTLLNLYKNKIGNIGCKYLSKALLPSINEIQLSSNFIHSGGVLHLSKANWSTLEFLYLDSNNIGGNGLGWLMVANFSNISAISIGGNHFSQHQARNLIKSENKLSYVYFLNHLIDFMSLQHIKRCLSLKFTAIYF